MAESTADCEVRDDWFLGQDVNAWTSMAYVAAGMVLAWEVRRARLPRAVLGLATLVVAEGLGSFLYHGAASDFGQFLHDVPLIGTLGFVAGWHVGRLFERSDRGSLAGLAVGVTVSSALWVVARGAIDVAVVATVVVIVAATLIARSRHLAGVWSAPLLALGAIAGGAWLGGTRDSPLCDPVSWWQPHGLWHLLTALLVLVWVDQAYGATAPEHPPRLVRRFGDRTIGLLARGLVLAFYRSVDVAWRSRLPRDRPILVVANHGNGFVDPVVVAAVLGRLPRFLAKAALWRVVVARPLLALAGVLPVYRSADGDRPSDNLSVFEACHRELAQRATVAIFPEGTTGDRAALDRVKSGAARIALGALATAPDLMIVPIGLAFENRVETRGRAVVMFGEPIVVADHARGADDGVTEPDRADVAELTETISRSLESVSPSFADVHERSVLRAAAATERSEHTGGRPPRFGDIEVVARRLATAAPEARQRVAAAYQRYATALQLIGIREAQLGRRRSSMGALVLSALAVTFAGSLLATVTLIHLPAVLIVVAGTATVRSTATKGTVRLLLGLVTGLSTWILTGMILADGWAAVATGVGCAIGGLVALFVWPPLVTQALGIADRVRVRDRVGLLPPVIEARSALVAAVGESIDADDG